MPSRDSSFTSVRIKELLGYVVFTLFSAAAGAVTHNLIYSPSLLFFFFFFFFFIVQEAFNATAHEFQPHVYFYSVSLDVLKSVGGSIGGTASSLLTTPAVMVFKDDTHFVYYNNNNVQAEGGGKKEEEEEEAAETLLDGSSSEENGGEAAAASNQSVTGAAATAAGSAAAAGLREWVNQERFPAFVEMTAGNFHQVMKTKKFIVMAVLEVDKVGRMTQAMTA
jgi:thioredoxin domain-containing protein 10